jgi:GT2 family glycosyltransferase
MLIITPVKNAIETTLRCARAIAGSSLKVEHIIYNDFSDAESKNQLNFHQKDIGYSLVHLDEITDSPSPNYKMVLELGRKEAIKREVPLIVVESDVIVEPDTFQKLSDFLGKNSQIGLLGSITVDEAGKVNFPYLKFKSKTSPSFKTDRSLSFCCTLFSRDLLTAFDFQDLDKSKDWYDTFMSKKAIELGFNNYILMDAPVLHLPHSSRPWKQLKYSNPLKYYFLKFFLGRDKI